MRIGSHLLEVDDSRDLTILTNGAEGWSVHAVNAAACSLNLTEIYWRVIADVYDLEHLLLVDASEFEHADLDILEKANTLVETVKQRVEALRQEIQ